MDEILTLSRNLLYICLDSQTDFLKSCVMTGRNQRKNPIIYFCMILDKITQDVNSTSYDISDAKQKIDTLNVIYILKFYNKDFCNKFIDSSVIRDLLNKLCQYFNIELSSEINDDIRNEILSLNDFRAYGEVGRKVLPNVENIELEKLSRRTYGYYESTLNND